MISEKEAASPAAKVEVPAASEHFAASLEKACVDDALDPSKNVFPKVTTPAVTARIMVTTLARLILFLLNFRFMHAIYFGYRDETVIVVVEQEPMYPAGRLCEIIA